MSVMASTGTGAIAGSMSGTGLQYNISTAIVNACDTDAAPITHCSATATVSGVPFPRSTVGVNELGFGDFEVTFGEGLVIENSTMLEKLAHAVGMTAMHYVATASDACVNTTIDTCYPRGECVKSTDYKLCTVPASILVEWYDGTKLDGPNDRIWVSFQFVDPEYSTELQAQEIIANICEDVLAATGFVAALIDYFCPEFAPLVAEGISIVEGTCQAIDSFNGSPAKV